jgi:general secretion pathway protein J
MRLVMNKLKGYTLIEVMIALMVFAILATMTTGLLKRILTQYKHLQENYQSLQRSDKLIAELQYQTQFYVTHPIKTEDNRQFPAFIGQHDYCEWTYTAPPNHTLYRIAYLCSQGQLIQKRWLNTQNMQRNGFQQKILLSGLSECRFRYANQQNHVTGYWSNDKKENPNGLQIMLAWNPSQKLELWFSLPPYDYEIYKK